MTLGQAKSNRIILAAAGGIMILVFGSFLPWGAIACSRRVRLRAGRSPYSLMRSSFVAFSFRPAMHLIGPANWGFLPKWVGRALPRLDIEAESEGSPEEHATVLSAPSGLRESVQHGLQRQRPIDQKGTKMIIVTGATGQLGTKVMHELLQRVPASDLVAAVRSPEKASNLVALGVTIRHCDYDKSETIASAFVDADRVLLISSNDFARSVDQHTAVIDTARDAGVELLAYTSLAHADTSTLRVAAPHKYTEPIIRESGVPFTLL